MKTKYEIQKNVPMPSRSKNEYPFGKMEVGDCFMVPYKDGEISSVRSRVTSAISMFVRGNPSYKFATRKLEENFGVWRIK